MGQCHLSICTDTRGTEIQVACVVIKYLKTVMWEKELYFVPVGNTKSGFGPNPERGILKFNTSENGEVPLELLGPKSLESSNGNYTTS